MKPTRSRYWVVVFAVALSILSYIDRVAMSKAAPYVRHDLNIDAAAMGRIFGAFGLGYALFEIPSGFLGDWMGPRKVLMRIVIWWSAFTAATGWMWSATVMRLVQFLFGAGEAGCFPNLTKAFTTWLQPNERTRAQGIMWMSARWGGAFTPLIVAYIFKFANWRAMFSVIAVPGIIWAVLFYRWFRDNPHDHPKVNAAELELLAANKALAGSHRDVPWLRLITSRSVILLWVQYFLISYPWYFYITWLSTYLKEYRGIHDDVKSGIYAIVPLFSGGLGCLLSGYLVPRVSTALRSVTFARRLIATLGFLGAAVFLVVCIRTADPRWSMAAMGAASFCNDLVMPPAWGACMDVGGKYAGTLSGSMNMMGNLAGFVAPQVGGIILARNGGDYAPFLYTMALAYLLGALCWPFIDPVTPLKHKET